MRLRRKAQLNKTKLTEKRQSNYKKITQLFHNSLCSSSLRMRVITTFFKNLDRTKISLQTVNTKISKDNIPLQNCGSILKTSQKSNRKIKRANKQTILHHVIFYASKKTVVLIITFKKISFRKIPTRKFIIIFKLILIISEDQHHLMRGRNRFEFVWCCLYFCLHADFASVISNGKFSNILHIHQT